MDTQDRLLLYGGTVGPLAFAIGWAVAWTVTPADLAADLPRWQVTLWAWLSAHGITIASPQLVGFAIGQSADLTADLPALATLQAYPIVLVTLAGLVVNTGMGYTRRTKYILQNNAAAAGGYLVTGMLAVVASGARPSVTLIIFVASVGLGGLAIGSRLINSATGGLPVLALVSLGGVVSVGLLVILGGAVLVTVLGPLVAVAAAGGVAGTVLTVGARRVPW